MITLIRTILLIMISVATFVATWFLLPDEFILTIQPSLRFFNLVFVVLLPASLHIKNKTEAISNISVLKFKQRKSVRLFVTRYVYRIWLIWLLYTLALLALFFVNYFSFSDIYSLRSGVAFCAAMLSLVVISIVNMFAMDMSVTSFTLYLKEMEKKLEEKENALDILGKEHTFSDTELEYFKTSITAVKQEKPRIRAPHQ
ncbi:hypothetical protein CGJ34_03595 [Vibrio parahaemolyticus]|nr:hypothetical protein CGJ34_03595 [Vibrio parahaemolyticus]